jgi:hypothetical protein
MHTSKFRSTPMSKELSPTKCAGGNLQLTQLAYRVNDTCLLLGIGRSSVYKLVDAGELKLLTIAGRRVVSAESILLLFRKLSA